MDTSSDDNRQIRTDNRYQPLRPDFDYGRKIEEGGRTGKKEYLGERGNNPREVDRRRDMDRREALKKERRTHIKDTERKDRGFDNRKPEFTKDAIDQLLEFIEEINGWEMLQGKMRNIRTKRQPREENRSNSYRNRESHSREEINQQDSHAHEKENWDDPNYLDSVMTVTDIVKNDSKSKGKSFITRRIDSDGEEEKGEEKKESERTSLEKIVTIAEIHRTEEIEAEKEKVPVTVDNKETNKEEDDNKTNVSEEFLSPSIGSGSEGELK